MAPTQHLVRLGSFFKSIGFVHVNSKRAGTAPWCAEHTGTTTRRTLEKSGGMIKSGACVRYALACRRLN